MYLQRYLAKNFGARAREKGALLFEGGRVRLTSGNQWEVAAQVSDARIYEVDLTRGGDAIHVYCECEAWDVNGTCKHIWAVILAADRQSYLLGAFGGRSPHLVDDLTEAIEEDPGTFEEDFDDDAFTPPSRAGKPGKTWKPVESRQEAPAEPAWRKLLRQVNTPPVSRAREDERHVEREVYYVVDASAGSSDGLFLRVENRERTRSGEWGKLKPCRLGLSQIPGIPGELDREILLALAGAPSAYYSDAEGVPYESRLKHAALDLLLPKICATSRCLLRTAPSATLEEMEALQWDGGEPWRFRVAVERQRKDWVVRGFLSRGGERMDLTEPAVLTDQGVAIARGRIARFDHGGAFSWTALLKKHKQIKAPAEQGAELVAEILQGRNPPEVDWPEELQVEEVRTAPRPVLKLSQKPGWNRRDPWRRPTSNGDRLQGQTFFEYSGELIPFSESGRGIYRPEQKRYVRRDPEAERAAIETLEAVGLKRMNPA
ncbi:MAG: SWIM zinc finger family protein, partial [Bryobacteraceae bacterium]